MGFKPYWGVYKLSRFHKELFGHELCCDLFVMLYSMLAPYSQSGNEAMRPALVWGRDTNMLPGPISRFFLIFYFLLLLFFCYPWGVYHSSG